MDRQFIGADTCDIGAAAGGFAVQKCVLPFRAVCFVVLFLRDFEPAFPSGFEQKAGIQREQLKSLAPLLLGFMAVTTIMMVSNALNGRNGDAWSIAVNFSLRYGLLWEI